MKLYKIRGFILPPRSNRLYDADLEVRISNDKRGRTLSVGDIRLDLQFTIPITDEMLQQLTGEEDDLK